MSFPAQKARLEFLTKIYNITQGDTGELVDRYEQGDKLGITRKDVQRIVSYLIAEGLVQEPPVHARSRAAGETYKISITHSGIKEIEEGLKYPQKSTEHFPPSVILNISGGKFHNTHFQISAKEITIAPNKLADMKQLVAELKDMQGIPDLRKENKEELEANTINLDKELHAERPMTEKVIETLSSIATILRKSSEIASMATPLAIKINTILTGMG